MRNGTTNHVGRRPGHHHHRRRGVRAAAGNAVLEMALVLMMLMFLVMGMVEYGQYFYVHQAFEAAARDGARIAIMPSATQAQVAAAMTADLAQVNVTYNPAWAKFYWVESPGLNVAVSDVSTIPQGYGVEVLLSTQYSALPTAVRPLSSLSAAAGIGTGKQVTGTCTMIRE